MSMIGVGRTDVPHLSVGPVGPDSFSTVLTRVGKVSKLVEPNQVPAQSIALIEVQIAGVMPGDLVVVSPPNASNGIIVGGAVVNSPSFISVAFTNPTTAPQTPMTGNYQFLIVR